MVVRSAEELDKLVEDWDFEKATRLFEAVLSPDACQAALKECVSANDFYRLVEIWRRMWSFLTPGAMFAAPVLGDEAATPAAAKAPPGR